MMRRSLIALICVASIFLSSCTPSTIIANKYYANCYGNITPCVNSTFSIGDPTHYFERAYIEYLYTANGTIGASNVTTSGGSLKSIAKFTTPTNIESSLIFDNGTNAGVGQFGMDLPRRWTIHDGSGRPQSRLSYTEGTIYTDLWSTSSGYFGILPSANRVGINNSAPTQALDVTGNGYFSGNVSLSGAYINSNQVSARDITFVTGTNSTLVLNSTVWDDLRTPLTATKTTPGVKEPNWAVAQTNGVGSTGVFLYWFSPTAENDIFFQMQVPHTYKLGTPVDIHVHWIPSTNGTANLNVRWGLEYVWKNTGQVYGNTTIIYSSTHYPQDVSLVANRHYYTILGDADIVPDSTQGGISSMFNCRLFRDATNLADNYTQTAGLMEIDMHFQRDTWGSRTEFAK